jgi:hypothetical protein
LFAYDILLLGAETVSLRKVLAHGFDSKSHRGGVTCRVVLSYLTSAKSMWNLCMEKAFWPLG